MAYDYNVGTFKELKSAVKENFKKINKMLNIKKICDYREMTIQMIEAEKKIRENHGLMGYERKWR